MKTFYFLLATSFFNIGIISELQGFDIVDSTSFITTWQTDSIGSSCNFCITIPTTGSGYNYEVDWDNDGVFDSIGMTGDVTHDFGIADTYTIRIRGVFPRIYFNNTGDKEKIVSVDQWGEIAWSSMQSAFQGCKYVVVPATDSPDLSSVENLLHMFNGAALFNQDISHWDVSNVNDMTGLFRNAIAFNQDLSDWDVSSVTNMSLMFYDAIVFDSPLNWNSKTASVENMSSMFYNADSFNQDLSNWDVSGATNMSRMFNLADNFNSPLNWGANTSSVANMADMFNSAKVFNQDLSNWDVSSVEDMSYMFASTDNFNGSLDWGATTGSVTTMSGMFAFAIAFNQELSGWDVSSVMDMSYMFSNATVFDSPLIWGIQTGIVTNMTGMFRSADVFNQNVTGWDVSSVTDMTKMFFDAVSFDQDLGDWTITSAADMTDMLDLTNLSAYNYDQTLTGWASQQVKYNVTLGALRLHYCKSSINRQVLITQYFWTIADDAEDAGQNNWSEVAGFNWNDDKNLWDLNRFPSFCTDVFLESPSSIILKYNKLGYGATLEVESGANLEVEAGSILEISNQ